MSVQNFVTLEQVVTQFSLTAAQVRGWMAAGKLRAVRFHHTLGFNREELERLQKESVRAEKASAGGPGPPAKKAEAPGRTPSQIREETRVLETVVHEHLRAGHEDEKELETVEADRGHGAKTSRKKPLPPGMVWFYCQCGKRLRAKAKYAGRSVTCTRCAAKVTVPAESQERRCKDPMSPVPEALEAIDVKPSHSGVGRADALSLEHRVEALERTVIGLQQSVEQLRRSVRDVTRQNDQVLLDVIRLSQKVCAVKPDSTTVPTPPQPAKADEKSE